MNFADLPQKYSSLKRSRVAVLPIPYDGTSTWMKGADKGPEAILSASTHLELYDIETDSEICYQGICTLPPVVCPDGPEDMVAAVRKKAEPLFQDNKFVVGLGGEHSVTVGLVQAAIEKFNNLTVLQFDAHSDMRDTYAESPFNHACVMARVKEMCKTVQVGVRSMDRSELKNINRDRLVLARDLHKHGIDAASDALDQLSDNVYITIDLDVLDLVVSQDHGGDLDWYMVNSIIARVAREKRIIGMDVVELLPNPQNRAPDFLAAKLIYRVLSMIFAAKV